MPDQKSIEFLVVGSDLTDVIVDIVNQVNRVTLVGPGYRDSRLDLTGEVHDSYCKQISFRVDEDISPENLRYALKDVGYALARSVKQDLLVNETKGK